MKVVAILPAAGLGTRMTKGSGGGRKQFFQLGGVPILVRTIRKFVAVDRVSEILVAVRPEDVDSVRQMIEEAAFAKPVRVVEGGNARQHSVQNALAQVPADADLVAVHDAVRPFIEVETINHVLDEAAGSGAAIVGVVPVDTVKQVAPKQSNRARIKGTIPREGLVLAQTPQVFRLDLIRRAFKTASDDRFIGTDESSLVERLEEVEVIVVPGSDRNIKITKPADLDLARLYLSEEEEEPVA